MLAYGQRRCKTRRPKVHPQQQIAATDCSMVRIHRNETLASSLYYPSLCYYINSISHTNHKNQGKLDEDMLTPTKQPENSREIKKTSYKNHIYTAVPLRFVRITHATLRSKFAL